MLRAHPTLLADMRLALLSELGAEAAYRQLARTTRDDELAGVLGRMHEAEVAQVRRLREVVSALGGRPRSRSLRRRLAARALALSTHAFGTRFALRVCHEAESTVARWYREYANHLVRVGELDAARACEELRAVKERHAALLAVWMEHLPPGSR